MRRAYRLLASFVASIRWVVLVKVALSVVILVYAASITATSNKFQAEIGSVTTVANGLIATDRGFNLTSTAVSASTTGTSCTTPATFGPSPGTANNAIAAGRLVFVVRINQTASAPPSTKFNVTFTLGGTTLSSLCIQTTGTPVLAGQVIDCKYDIGSSSLPSSPFTFKVTVQ